MVTTLYLSPGIECCFLHTWLHKQQDWNAQQSHNYQHCLDNLLKREQNFVNLCSVGSFFWGEGGGGVNATLNSTFKYVKVNHPKSSWVSQPV